MSKPLSLPRLRQEERKGLRCKVKACPSPVHGLSSYCSRHHTAHQRHGSPTQRRILKSDLRPYRRRVERILEANRDHPALTMVIAELDGLLSNGVAHFQIHGLPDRDDWRGKQARELARLTRAGITGADIFTTCAALHFYARDNPSRLEPYTRAFNFALARHTLNLAHRERHGGWSSTRGWLKSKVTRPLSSRVLDHLGRHLATSLIGVFLALEPVFDGLEKRRQKSWRQELSS